MKQNLIASVYMQQRINKSKYQSINQSINQSIKVEMKGSQAFHQSEDDVDHVVIETCQ
jgi:primosomal replication protein N